MIFLMVIDIRLKFVIFVYVFEFVKFVLILVIRYKNNLNFIILKL